MKKILIFLCVLLMTATNFCTKTNAAPSEELNLHAKAAVLMDADSKRVLYGKNEDEILPMASTTKIMTLMVALKYGDLNDTVAFSKYAASQPDVQLDALAGEQYFLKDLLTVMMLKSYNDVAVAVAEYVGEKVTSRNVNPDKVIKRGYEESKRYVRAFAGLMNKEALELGCTDTYFITPNGLDASDFKGKHSTTAKELAIIASAAMKNEKVLEICQTRNFTFSEINGKRTKSVSNMNIFLDMRNGACGFKTGFTNDAGYCFVGAVKSKDKQLVSVVLGCGWPPHKTYKWSDTKQLMDYGISKFEEKTILMPKKDFPLVPVINGTKESVAIYSPFEISLLISSNENLEIIWEIKEYLAAPVKKNSQAGNVRIIIDGKEYGKYPLLTSETAMRKDLNWYIKKIFLCFLL